MNKYRLYNMLLFGLIVLFQACQTETTTKANQSETADPPPSSEDVKVVNPIAVGSTSASETIKSEVVPEMIPKTIDITAETAESFPPKEAKPATSAAKKKSPKPKPKPRPSIKFDQRSHEFGIIKPGDKVEHKFYFTNTGKADLVIKGADVTCGCTAPSYPFVPIAPGERGYIGVTYDSTGKLGKQKPTVTLTTNAGTQKIYMEGYVISEMATETPSDSTTHAQ